MNFKKFKKSLVSIVLGSSLFLVNGGVICQQPKAWLTDKFFTNAKERYKDDQNIQLLLMVSEFLSDIRSIPSILKTKPLQRTEKLFDDAFDLTILQSQALTLKSVLHYLARLEPCFPDHSAGLSKLIKKLEAFVYCTPSNDLCHSEKIEDYLSRTEVLVTTLLATTLLYASALPLCPTDQSHDILMEKLDVLHQTLEPKKDLGQTTWMIQTLSDLFSPSEEKL